jgi:3',5'-nucleoside bisphosphate phosphatase
MAIWPRHREMHSEFIDLHSHSTASDGTFAPRDVVRMAHRAGLSALALTDHDTVAGCADAADEAKKLGIGFLCGIEISAEYPKPGTLHLLGYGVDPNNDELANLMKRLIEGRTARNKQIVAALNEQGVSITLDEVLAQANGGTVGRPHIAAILVRKGYVSSTQQAFDKYLGQGGKVYFDKETITPKRAIQMIHNAGGVSVVAHPVQLRKQNNAQLETALKELIDYGLQGIEVIHSDHDDAMIEKLSAIAERYKLTKTGGSDFHGASKPNIELGKAGKRRIPRELFDNLRERIAAINTAA